VASIANSMPRNQKAKPKLRRFFIKQKIQPDVDMVTGYQEEKRELKYTTFIFEANPDFSF